MSRKAALRRYAPDRILSAAKHGLQLVKDSVYGMTYSERVQYQLRQEIFFVKEQIAHECPDNPVLCGFKVYCQVDEDGIIQELFRRVPSDKLDQTLVEIGCGDGRENNTHYLMLQGYRGFWVDGSKRNIDYLNAALGLTDSVRSRLKVAHRFVDTENIDAIIREASNFIQSPEPDLFSLDIDGNEFFVLIKALMAFQPKFLCVEYNAKFPPPLTLTIEYNARQQWTGDDYQGCSLQILCDSLDHYTLVACNISGSNAFFVRNDLRNHFTSYPIKKLYQPLRSNLRFLAAGHPPSLKWLKDALGRNPAGSTAPPQANARSRPLHSAGETARYD